jgi:DNA-binding YbaB/EbfC family protein
VKNLTDLMKQAQEVQGKMQEVQQRLAASLIEGSSGGGMVKVTMKGTGELAAVDLDESLLRPGEGEMISDLLIAAHADAKRKMDARQAELLREVAGPLAGLPGMPF